MSKSDVLTKVLQHAISSARNSRPTLQSDTDPGAKPFTSRTDSSIFDVKRAANQFKLNWIYSDRQTYQNPICSANGSIFFLLSKNLSVTDISSAELIHLCEENCFLFPEYKNGENAVVPDFLDDSQYTKYIENLLLPFSFAKVAGDEIEGYIAKVSSEISKYHFDFLTKTIAFDRLYTSVLFHIPRSLSVNIEIIVARSGYIHCAGPSIYARRAEKAAESEILDNISEYLDSNLNKQCYFVPYSKSHFSLYQENDYFISPRNGLSEIQFELNKQFIGSHQFSDVLLNIKKKFSDRVHFAEGVDAYDTERENGKEFETSVILLYDNRFTNTGGGNFSPSSDRLFFIFEQAIVNTNQLNIFKERKPAWAGPVTLPHTLSAAIVNIIRTKIPSTDANYCPLVIDPFCGTGTCLFDASVRMPNARIVGFDRNSVSPILVADNLRFFRSDPDLLQNDVENLVTTITDIISRDDQRHGKSSRTAEKVRQASAQLRAKKAMASLQLVRAALHAADPNERADIARRKIYEGGFSEEILQQLKNSELFDNILFFLSWRALAQGIDPQGLPDNIILNELEIELRRFLDEIAHLIQLSSLDVIKELDGFSISKGVWGTQTSIAKSAWPSFLELSESEINKDMGMPGRVSVCNVQDSVKALKRLKGEVDVVIGDPPYWFNTDGADAFEAQAFYSDFIESAVESLKDGGQLALAVLQYSRNGRTVPFYQTRGAITRKVISTAHKLNKRVVSFAKARGGRLSMSEPPFYWNSRSVLSRRILWFMIESR